MSDEMNFLARWSRRKHDAATDKIKQSKPEKFRGDLVSGTSTASLAPGENRRPFDPASLPTIESIGAGSDIRAFLEAGVPDDLAQAALRRVWSLDLTIRDFVGLSENSWDFNATGAMPGFGPIDGEDAGRLLTRLLGEPETTAAAAHPPLMTPPADVSQKTAGGNEPADRQATSPESVALVSTRAQQLDLDKVNVADDAAQHGRTDASQHGATSPERLSKTSRRGHGSALPQLP
jgi:hypothetical protein